MTRSPFTRSHSGLPTSADKKPSSSCITSLGHCFFVSAQGPTARCWSLTGYSVADHELQPVKPEPRSVPSIFRLISNPVGTGLPLSSLSDHVWSSGKFFCSGGSGLGVSSSSLFGPFCPAAKAVVAKHRAPVTATTSEIDFSMRVDLDVRRRRPRDLRIVPPFLCAGNLPIDRGGSTFCGEDHPFALEFGPLQTKMTSRGAYRPPNGGRSQCLGRKPSYRSTIEDVIMSNYDLSPFYRSTVGFDRLFSMLDRVAGGEQNAPTYPPYNIERTGENAYRITLAVAGFSDNELSVETRENTLTVRGTKETTQQDEKRDLLYQGIAARAFERRFQLADHVVVTGAGSENGLLHIDLVREVPEAQKPRTIAINKGAKTIEAVKAPSAKAA